MSGSAGLQLNLEAGPPDGWADRLRRLQRLGPVLLAMSACSAVYAGSAGGSVSMRQQAWFAIETARTAPVRFGENPPESWADYALNAPLMLVRDDRAGFAESPAGLSFGGWTVAPDRIGRRPTIVDLDYHLTTLFPVIRPRGFLELRFLDASPARFWPGLAAIVATLIDDPVAAARADEFVDDLDSDWQRAARLGLRDQKLRRVAAACAGLAVEHCPEGLRDDVSVYAEMVSGGRAPGDLLLHEAGADGWRLLEAALDS